MPRAPDGRYTLPFGSIVEAGELVVPSQHNPPLNDLAQAMTDSLSRDGRGEMRANLGMGGNRLVNCSPGVNPNDAATIAQIQAITGVPIGGMMDWPTAQAPTGWLICAGQDLSRLDYAALFALIGVTYGSANSSTFRLPDLRGRVSVGLDVNSGGFASRMTLVDSKVIGAAGGVQSVALTEAQIAAHDHPGTIDPAGEHFHLVSNTGNSSGSLSASNTMNRRLDTGGSFSYDLSGSSAAASVGKSSTAANHTHPLSIGNAGGGEAHPNVQPTIIINKIIKAL